MEPFRTVLNAGISTHKVSLKDAVITAGSCFSDAMGARLQEYKIRSLVNPFGNIYNPHSIHKSLQYAALNLLPDEQTYLENQGIHLNYNFHSSFSARDSHALAAKLTEAIRTAHTFLKDANWLIITYGTAWVYEHLKSGQIVANCHKMPSGNFKKSLLTQKKIIESFTELYDVVKKINPALRIIVTVSPVRHIKDTLELNSVSKSVLRLSCHTLTEIYNDVEYFPSYEIMMDDLRDYRFYKADMLHPTVEAENYIWKIFTEKYCDQQAKTFIEKWKNFLPALTHRPFQPSSPAHQRFLKQTLTKLEELKTYVNVDKELDLIKQQIIPDHF